MVLADVKCVGSSHSERDLVRELAAEALSRHVQRCIEQTVISDAMRPAKLIERSIVKSQHLRLQQESRRL